MDDLGELLGNQFATNENDRGLLAKIQLIEDSNDYAGQYTEEIGCMLFNEKPKKGIQFCIENKIIKKIISFGILTKFSAIRKRVSLKSHYLGKNTRIS